MKIKESLFLYIRSQAEINKKMLLLYSGKDTTQQSREVSRELQTKPQNKMASNS